MFRKIATASLAAFVTAIALAGPAAAGNSCKKVYLKVLNQTGAQIKVIDLDYWNPATSRYKSEPTRNKVIPNGQPWSDVRNLEQVNARNTWIRVKFREKQNGKWSKVQKAQSAAAVCGQNASYQIVLH